MDKFSGFYKLTVGERIKLIAEEYKLTTDEIATLTDSGALKLEFADRMIENVVGVSHLPLGLGTNFLINNRAFVVPMMLEEPSVVAAASKAAKLTLPAGFSADADEPIMIGQIQIVNLPKPENAFATLNANKDGIMLVARQHAEQIEQYGGGARGVEFKLIKTVRGAMIICDFAIDVRDSMGANTVNTILEGVAPTLAEMTGGKIRLRIISNLATKRLVRASAVWKKEIIGEDGIEGVLDAYEFAKNDPYRCATHNKGIMNGVDAVTLATGNDWRAIEAGAHAYAAIGGYHPLTTYEKDKHGNLVGKIELPMAIATVGGAVNTNPIAKISLKILRVKTSKELAMVAACVGLANNFSAIYALSTEGIQKGHMKLHARNIAVIAGAKTIEEIDYISKKLADKKDFSVSAAKKVLEEINNK